MTNCEKLLLYVNNELSSQEAKDFEEHLHTCASCQKSYAFVKKMDELTPCAPAVPTEIMDALFAKTTHKPSLLLRWKKALIGAALVGVSVFTIFASLKSSNVSFDARELVAYMNTTTDTDYLSFADELSTFEENF